MKKQYSMQEVDMKEVLGEEVVEEVDEEKKKRTRNQ